MNLDWVDRQDYYSDKDLTILNCFVGDQRYCISSLRSGKYLVQYAQQGVWFEAYSIEMAHNIMKRLLGV